MKFPTIPSPIDSSPPKEEGKLNVFEFYRGATVLITGGTGFIGKVLVEKLLRSFEVKKLFLLVRRKGSVSPAQRLRHMLEGPIFDTLRNSTVDAQRIFDKVVAVNATFEQADIVDDVDKAKICNEVQIVFHVMASIRFDEALDDAIAMNVTSARRLYTLANGMAKLRAIVHVSTFYSNCNREHIEERIYDDVPFGGIEHIQQMLGRLDQQEKKHVTQLILGKMPNTYVFSKKCAEAMIGQDFRSLPIGIFRPPIVISSYREPEPGWIDCFHGATGLCVPLVLGKTMWYYGKPEIKPFMVPVDYTVAGMIAAACDVHRRQCSNLPVEKPVAVYNYTFAKNAFSYRDYIELVSSGLPNRMDRWMSRIKCHITPWRIFPNILLWLVTLQARVADEVLAWFGKRGRNVKIVTAIAALADAVEYFRCNMWTMDNRNVKHMISLLSTDDTQRLDIDGDRINWTDFHKYYVKGIAKELMRTVSNRSKNRKLSKDSCKKE